MPHFIIDCSPNIIQQEAPEKIMDIVYTTAESAGLFAENDIKVRLQPYPYYRLGKNKESFIHIFGYIMEGRSTEQKADLAHRMVTNLTELFPDISFLSMSINDFETATYSNKSLINPENKDHNRHFEC